MWNVEKIVSKGDYNYAIVRNHPARTKNDYVLEHRVVMENHLSRLLNTNEVVHHINHNKKDNRIENLYIMDKKEHNKILSTTGRKYFILKCPHCHIIFYRERRNSLLANKSQASFRSR
jgi:agmatine/peptidylarginine deiminase